MFLCFLVALTLHLATIFVLNGSITCGSKSHKTGQNASLPPYIYRKLLVTSRLPEFHKKLKIIPKKIFFLVFRCPGARHNRQKFFIWCIQASHEQPKHRKHAFLAHFRVVRSSLFH